MGCRKLQPNDCFRFVGDDKHEPSFPRGNRKYKSIAEGFIITDYVDASGSVQAHYKYSPFGKITASSGAMEDDFDYRFSSEVYDSESGLVYYNYRYYSAELGRWLSRDPIGEKGGFNLYAMVGNDAVGEWDYLGIKIEHVEFTYSKGETTGVGPYTETSKRGYHCSAESWKSCSGNVWLEQFKRDSKGPGYSKKSYKTFDIETNTVLTDGANSASLIYEVSMMQTAGSYVTSHANYAYTPINPRPTITTSIPVESIRLSSGIDGELKIKGCCDSNKVDLTVTINTSYDGNTSGGTSASIGRRISSTVGINPRDMKNDPNLISISQHMFVSDSLTLVLSPAGTASTAYSSTLVIRTHKTGDYANGYLSIEVTATCAP